MARTRGGMVEVEFTFADFRADLRSFTKKQVPFAFSLAINNTIRDTQDALKGDLPSVFTIRSTWTAKGIRTERATKKNLIGTVGSVDPFMKHQATGGVRTARRTSLAIPKKARPRKTSKTPRSKHPGALLKSGKGAFFKRMPDDTTAVFMPRKTRKGSKRKRPKLRLMWYLVPRVPITQRWDLETTLLRVVDAEWAGHMRLAWAEALRTARRPRR